MTNSLVTEQKAVPATNGEYSKLQFSRAYNQYSQISKQMKGIESQSSENIYALLGDISFSETVLSEGDKEAGKEDIMRLVVDLFGGYPPERQAGMETMKETLITYLAARNSLTVGALRAAVERVHLECKFVPSIAEFFECLEDTAKAAENRLTLYRNWADECEGLLKKRNYKPG
jgi:hypothetical protein